MGEPSTAYLSSGSALIKALKAPVDPPQPEWPSKAEIAARAWASALAVPRKADVLRDFVLEAWTRSKAAAALADPAYHRLLVAVSPSCSSPAQAAPPLLSAFLSASASSTAPDLFRAAHDAFAVLFPPGALHKAEAWTDVFVRLVETAGARAGADDDGLVELASLISDRLTVSFAASQNQKKIAQTLADALPAFARAHRLHPALQPVLGPAAQLLLPLSTLQTVDPLRPVLAALAPAAPSDALHILPLLLSTYIARARAHRYPLFSRASDKAPVDVAVADKLRAAVLAALGQVLDAAAAVAAAEPADVWAARRGIWEAVAAWGGYLETDTAGAALVEAEAGRAADVLVTLGGREDEGEGLAGSALRTLDVLERLDHARAAIGPAVVGWCLASPARTHVAARTLLASLLRYHQLTHTLPAFLDLIVAAARELLPASLPDAITLHLYKLVASGVLADRAFRGELAAAVRGVNLGGRRGAAWAALVGRLSAAVAGDAGAGGASHERTTAHAAFVAVLSRVLRLVLDAGAAATAGTADVEAAAAEAAAAYGAFPLAPAAAAQPRKKRKSDAGAAVGVLRAPADHLVAAARLRVARAARLVRHDVADGVDVEQAAAVLRADAQPELSLAAYALTRLCLAPAPEAVVDALVDVLAASSKRAWSGRDADVTTKTLGAAAWTFAAERGLAVFEARATAAQLARLAGALLEQSKRAVEGLSASAAVHRLLGSAETWELSSLRAALLKTLVEAARAEPAAAYGVLVRCPVAWLSKAARATLLDAAYEVDEAAAEARAVVRQWLGRLAQDGIFGPLDAKMIRRLVKSLKDAEGDVATATLALLDSAYAHICKLADRHDVLLAVLEDAAESKPFAKWAKRARAEPPVPLADDRARAVLLLCERAMALPLDRYPADVRAALARLHAALAAPLVPVLEIALARRDAALLPAIEAQRTAARLAAYLSLPPTPVARRLLPLALRDPALAPAAFDLVATESADGETVLAAYVLLSRAADVGAAWARYLRSADAAAFGAALTGCVALIQAGHEEQAALGALQAVLATSVEGSGRVVAASLQDLLATLDAASRKNTRTMLAVLDALTRLVESRTGLLKPNDLSAILVILQHALLPASAASPAAPASPAPETLAKVLAMLLALARHRADLVRDRLAPVVAVAAAALAALARPRAMLGKAARARALARLPAWVGADDPEADAHLLARLLSNLAAARLPGADAGASGTSGPAGPAAAAAAAQGTQGTLARPLAKLAPAVLVAYARAAADPHAHLSPAVRRALEPGLHALCAAVTAGGRAGSRGREGEGVGRAWGLGEGAGGDAENEVWAAMWIGWARARYAGRG